MHTQKGAFALALATILLFGTVACDLGKVLLSDDELGAMYSFDFSQSGTVMEAGSMVDPDEALSLSIAIDERAPEPARIEIVLSRASGDEAARLVVVEEGSTEGVSDGQTISVKDISSPLPPLMLPEGLAYGYYSLSVDAYGATGNRLSSFLSLILLYDGSLPPVAIAAYPAAATGRHSSSAPL